MAESAYGRVVKVFDDHTVLVNLGTDTDPSVGPGTRLVIFELGEEVRDPETNESLGRIEWVKARVEVTEAQPKMSIAETPGTTEWHTEHVPTVPTPARIAAALQGIYGPSKPRQVKHTDRKAFKVDQALLEPPKVDLSVKPGDAVRVDTP